MINKFDGMFDHMNKVVQPYASIFSNEAVATVLKILVGLGSKGNCSLNCADIPTLLDHLGKDFKDRRVGAENITVGGEPAVHVVVRDGSEPSSVEEYVFVEKDTLVLAIENLVPEVEDDLFKKFVATVHFFDGNTAHYPTDRSLQSQ